MMKPKKTAPLNNTISTEYEAKHKYTETLLSLKNMYAPTVPIPAIITNNNSNTRDLISVLAKELISSNELGYG
jgi:hypothetical protein